MLALAVAVAVAALPCAATATASSNSSAVCTPDLCLEGQTALAAGVVVSSPVNGSTRQITLLPGTYTPSSPAFSSSNASASSSSNASLASAVFSRRATAKPSNGFSSSGSLATASSFTVELLDGVTAYSNALYQGQATYLALPTNTTTTNSSSLNSTTSAATTTSIRSLLFSPSSDSSSLYAILSTSSTAHLVLWSSVADFAQINALASGAKVVDVQSAACPKGCASAGRCVAGGTCVCETGWEGETCDTCSKGFFGPTCQPCPAGCASCDDGLTGSGLCLSPSSSSSIVLPSACNCVNGLCASNSTTATCECSAGWTTAANGTQCATCAAGYYLSPTGDCLACDPTCASCSSPTGTCLTCQPSLQPTSSSPTTCIASSSALQNGTFVTCPSRTYWDSTTQQCRACDPMCDECFGAGVERCSSCREPNVLMPAGKGCVAVDSKTGVCDASSGVAAGNGTASRWVFDNAKGVCDALPAKCVAGGINSFSSTSTRAQLVCSKCLPGSFLVNGACVDECPAGTMASSDGTSCQACDSSCATCANSPSYCTSCASSSALVLNGTCISGPSCPAGFFSSPSSSSPLAPSPYSSNLTAPTCLPCHPDCATCTASPTTCLTCPASRPVFLAASSSCAPTCPSPTDFFDSNEAQCVACDDSCGGCAGAGPAGCTSCKAGSGTRLVQGRCEAPSDGCRVMDGWGVCLEDLVTVEAAAQADGGQSKWKMPWWAILVLLVCAVALVVLGVLIFRRREQRRRRLQTARFARDLGDKEVDKKLAALPISIAYPPLPRASSPSPSSSFSYLSPARPPPRRPSPPPQVHGKDLDDVPLTPRFVLEDPSSPISPSLSPSRSSYAPSSRPPQSPGGAGPKGESVRTFTTKAGNTLTIQSKNPYLSRI